MKKIYSLLLVPISILSFTQFNVNSEELKSKKGLISLNQNNLNNNLFLSTDSSDDKNVDIFLNGIGDNPQIDKTIQKDLILLPEILFDASKRSKTSILEFSPLTKDDLSSCSTQSEEDLFNSEF